MSSTETTDASDHFPLASSLHSGVESIDLAGSSQERAEKLLESLQRNMPGLSGEQLLRVIMANEHSGRRMAEEGVIYAANFVGRSAQDPTAATTAQFTVLVRHAELKASQPLTVLAEELRGQTGREVDFVDLTVGRCLAVVQEDQAELEVNLTGAESQETRRSRQFQLIVPMANRNQLAIFALATEFLWDWDDYGAMMAEICQTISWSETQRRSIASKLEGL
ncbi:hypothetical protein FHX42_002867 [Saccharopolyspora lacisalsi]|uniref:Uncharacterized protein n=1 Tax=Halosaccharopolyspora lacisalsi TaxID=1000566 RepID=A0A839DZ50_9PSEU|nr:hypothetical protein [Halosaccharopolyspora lacisalsi]MBA8825516.1 hypothetical protein [Halosaccharopolyspora lacisalsi]